jgi:hypothetical protein
MTLWTKSEDRLPLVGQFVLLKYAGVGVCEGYLCDDGYWEVVFLAQHGCGCCGGGGYTPEYWMEIPE